MIHEWARLGPEKVKAKREQTLAYYKDRAKALEEEERPLHEKLHKDVQSVIKEKRILLFKEMLQDIGYDDMSVVELLSVGVRIIGLCQNTGIWTDSDEKLPRTTVRHLMASAKELKKKS